MSRDEALALAKDHGTDLIEVVAQATPPVARLISFDKYRYQIEKQEKKEKKAQKTTGLKQVQTSARASQHDLEIKARQAEKFLEEGHQVEIQLRLRGREKYNKPWANQKMEDFLRMITVEYKIISPPKFGGRGMGVYITKK